MPNWVKNRLNIKGENAEAVLNELITTDENGDRNFDFNKIIPMPKSLEIISGTVTDRCLALYLTAANPNAEYYGSKSDKLSHAEYGSILEKLKASGRRINGLEIMLPIETIAEYEKTAIGNSPEWDAGQTREEAIAYGKRAVDNVLQYGHMNWYDWSIANWGTKWNACHTHIDGTTVEFDTAWADVSDLMCKLSEKYPDNTFLYDFAEEQAGYYSGEFTFENGDKIGGGYFEEYTKAAFEKSFEFWGGEYNFKYNKRTKTYEFIDDEAASDSGSEM